MAETDKKKKGGKVKKLIRQAGPNISEKEMKRITEAAGGNVRKAVNTIAAVQRSQKKADKVTTGLGSKASNMLIRQAAKDPRRGFDPFGTSKLGKTLESMMGTPSTQRYVKGQVVGQPGTPMQRVDPGMSIRLGGGIGPKKRPKKRPKQTTGFDQSNGAGLTEDEINKRIQEGIQSGINNYFDTLDLDSIFGQQTQDTSILDAIAGMGEMFSSAMGGYQQSLSDQMALMNQFAAPQQMERLFGAGQNYYTDAIRAAQRNQQRRTGYMRGGMGIGGQSGVTTGAPTSGLNIGSALGILGGVTG